jgi:poly(3-hydroxybutyrate) depolymerase
MIRNRLLAATLLFGPLASPASAATTVEVTNFGSNPGKLRMFKHIPDKLPTSAPLVVVMHGCTQNAVTYTDASGWTQMSDQLHVALVMPQQQQANNSNLCFNWYDPTKTTRDQGEAMSIKQMIDKMKANYSIDASRVFVTGLSAGGAMTSVMLADYPMVALLRHPGHKILRTCCHESARKRLTSSLPARSSRACRTGARTA